MRVATVAVLSPRGDRAGSDALRTPGADYIHFTL